MKATSNSTANDIGKNEDRSEEKNLEKKVTPRKSAVSRRYFLGKSLAVGAGTIGAGLLANAAPLPRPTPTPPPISGGLTAGDAALLRFAAAAEILEADFWIQYNELGGIQDPEVPGGTGNPAYTDALNVLDEDMTYTSTIIPTMRSLIINFSTRTSSPSELLLQISISFAL